MKSHQRSLIFSALFCAVTAIFTAFYIDSGKTLYAATPRIILSLGDTVIALSVATAFVAWVLGMTSFVKVLRCPRDDIFLKDALPLNFFFVLSARYLSAEGLTARRGLLRWLAIFFVACSVPPVLILGVQASCHLPWLICA
ncbi:MAG: hypothetical protein ACRYG5_04255 [Janthinobacterium lividum]